MTRRRVAAWVAVLAVCLAANAGWRWWHNRPPYGPQALAATASLEFVTEQAAQAALGDGVHAPPTGPGDQLILGRVSWRLPPTPQPGGAFWIVVLDKRTELKPGTFAVGSPLHQQVSIASGGTLQRVADRFPWLRGAGAQHVNGGWWEAGSALNVPAAAASPLTFVAQLPAADKSRRPEHAVAAAPAAISDLMVALASVGPDEQVYWAQRLVG